MGKNQAYKAMQRSRLGSSSADPEQIEDGMVDSSFHSPEWHAARLASLKTSNTVTWEEYKKKQKEDEIKKGEVEADTNRMMKEYRAQLDAERSLKLAQGRNHSSTSNSKLKPRKADRKEKDSRRHSSKRKRRSSREEEFDSGASSSSSSSSSDTSSSDEDGREPKKKSKSKRSSRRKKKDRKHHRRKAEESDSSGGEGSDGPVPLSRFFGNGKKA